MTPIEAIQAPGGWGDATQRRFDRPSTRASVSGRAAACLLVAALAAVTIGGAVLRLHPTLGGLLLASGVLLLPATFCLWSWTSGWFRWQDVDHSCMSGTDWRA